MPLWTPISSGTYAAGKLWTPDFTLALMGRDWANMFTAWTWYLPSLNLSQDADGKTADIGVCFPDSWDADAAYPAVMKLSLDMESKVGGDDPTVFWSASTMVWLKIGSVLGPVTTHSASGVGGAQNTKRVRVEWTAVQGALPVGPTNVELWTNSTWPSTPNTLARATTYGNTSWYGFQVKS